MKMDINIIFSLISLVITLSTLFGIFYKMNYQIKELTEEQKKYNHLQERMAKAQLDITRLDTNQKNILQDIDELKTEIKNGRKQSSA